MEQAWRRAAVVLGVVVAACSTAAAQLRQTPLGDGTGSIGLAPGFQITEGYRGSVTCAHANGALVALGIPWAVLRTDSGLLGLPAAQQTPIARTGDVVTALREILAKKAGARLTSLRSREAPPALAGVPAYYLMYEYVLGGRAYTAIGYVTTIDNGPSAPWQLYASAIIAPTGSFVKLYPTLMAMWRSWRPNGQEPTAGSQSAKIDEILRDRRERYEDMQEAFRRNL